MDAMDLPRWMIRVFGFLLIILMLVLILNQLFNLKRPHQILSVTAEGKVTAVPDQATVTIGLTSQGSDPVDVKNKNNQKINQIIAFIKQQGIDAKDIQTSNFYASPNYNYANGQNTITGYQTNQTVTIKIKEIDKSQTKLEKILDGAVNNGANEIQGVNFSFTNTDKFKQEARIVAIHNAKQKAEELTRETGLRLGRVANVIESGRSYNPPMPYAMATMGAKVNSVAPNVEPGSQEVIENITLLFEVC